MLTNHHETSAQAKEIDTIFTIDIIWCFDIRLIFNNLFMYIYGSIINRILLATDTTATAYGESVNNTVKYFVNHINIAHIIL